MLFECKEARGSERGNLLLGEGLEVSTEHEELYGHVPAYSRAVLVPKTTVHRSFVRRCMDELPLDEEVDDKFHWRLNKRHRVWRDMVESYSMRNLTNGSDRFPALSGLASEMAYSLNDEYIAGLWKGNIINGLCWTYPKRHQTGSARKTNYGPTWSWATTTAPISYNLVADSRDAGYLTGIHRDLRAGFTSPSPPAAHQTDASTQTPMTNPRLLAAETLPAGDDPNGTLLSASLQFEGQCIAVRRSKSGNCIIDGESIAIWWDHLPQPVSEIFLFSLGKIQVGIVLTPRINAASTYQRVGLVPRVKSSWFKDSETQILTLV